MHDLIVTNFWLTIALKLRLPYNIAIDTVLGAYQNISLNYLSVSDYSEEILESVKLYEKHKDSLSL